MPAKKKEAKVEEPVFVDEQGSYIHERERARYEGGIRRYISAAAAAAQESATANANTNSSSAAGSGRGGKAAGASNASARKEEKAPESAVDDGCLAVFRHGTGTYTSPTLRYTGEWREDTMEGNGSLSFLLTGSRYTGAFWGGKFEGIGTYTWADGSSYEGQWRANRMHGDGVYMDAQGTVWKGQFFNGTGPGLNRVYHNAAAATAGDAAQGIAEA